MAIENTANHLATNHFVIIRRLKNEERICQGSDYIISLLLQCELNMEEALHEKQMIL